jgi:hypothetical protein
LIDRVEDNECVFLWVFFFGTEVLWKATEGKIGTDEKVEQTKQKSVLFVLIYFCSQTCISIITTRSHDHMGKQKQPNALLFCSYFVCFVSAAVDNAFVARSKKHHTLRKCLDGETRSRLCSSLCNRNLTVCFQRQFQGFVVICCSLVLAVF